MSHDIGPASFYLPKSVDLSLLGEYTFTIRSEITVPDDYTMTTSTVIFVEEIVTVYVEPCFVDTYIDTIRVADITYNIAVDDKNYSHYEFDETPFCNYP
jgi:hypothetical protein